MGLLFLPFPFLLSLFPIYSLISILIRTLATDNITLYTEYHNKELLSWSDKTT
ncbi:hypothetical protein BDV30DRAFT_203969 [Aspergillus minisclerotigenes]|uniref:Uncharacterized protein n=1 Tax=Aspergillus minisclerotigenes TaxID=656917 RepID=A0A5N6JJU6_9EURO|nr:hypothetical protein BDV30DRAFT_203969 [Aspergillus minisclerotigenes]